VLDFHPQFFSGDMSLFSTFDAWKCLFFSPPTPLLVEPLLSHCPRVCAFCGGGDDGGGDGGGDDDNDDYLVVFPILQPKSIGY